MVKVSAGVRRGDRRKRLAAVVSVVALSMSGLIALASPSQAAPGPVAETPAGSVTADRLPTVQIDGVVWAQKIVGNTVYVGGKFTTARPAGAAPGVNTTPRSNMLAYNLTTGALITSFNPVVNSEVYAFDVSPDGTRLYVGGKFTTINGLNRYRLAAFDIASGALISNFVPPIDYNVRAIVATATTVYVGGLFSTAGGQPRTRLAAFQASNGAVTGWAPTADSSVQAMVMTPDKSKVIIGGAFLNVNGAPASGLAALDPVTGASVPWNINQVVRNGGTQSAILDLDVSGNSVYGVGYKFGSSGNFEGSFRADQTTGDVIWLEDCHGDTYAISVSNGAAYTGSHAHYCGNIGGFPQTDPWSTNQRYSLAFTDQPTGTIGHDPLGYTDWFGRPSPSLINWFPTLTTGTASGQGQSVWQVESNNDYVLLGGEFQHVNGVAQQGLVRMAKRPIAPAKQGPLRSGDAFVPYLQSLASGSVRVGFLANTDRDNRTLSYRIIRDGALNAPIATISGDASYWERMPLAYNDTGLTPGSTHSYQVVAVDPDGNTAVGSPATIVVGAGPGYSYPQAVLDDLPVSYWRLGEASGTNVVDWAGTQDSATFTGVTRGVTGAIVGDPDKASGFDGGTGGLVSPTTSVLTPKWFSVEAWFKTNTTRGGKIVGYGNLRSGSSSQYDRHIYMDNTGRLNFGVAGGSAVTITSSLTYRDNIWHHAVGTQDANGISFYVDGKLIGTNPASTAGSFSGYWRIGGDNLSGWPNRPTNSYFAGSIDDVAIYSRALTATQIQTHYLRGGGNVPNISPTAAYTSSVADGTLSVDGATSSDPDGSIVSYQWNWGDGTALGSGVTANHTYAASGTYQVRLTVTDNKGATGTIVKGIQVAPNVAPKAVLAVTPNGLSVSADSAGSSDSDGSITGYTWEWGDSTPNGSGATATHTYAAGGTYQVKLTVTDDDGATGTATTSVQVTAPPPNQPPTAAFTSSVTDLSVAVDGSGSTDADGTVQSYSWNWGDSSPDGSGATASHTYAAPGAYTVTLTVTDDDQATDTDSAQVTVTAPTVLATDAFARSVAAGGWGAADTGGSWTVGGGSTSFSVADGVGKVATSIGGQRTATLSSVSSRDVDTTVTVNLATAPTGGGTSASVLTRINGSSHYRAQLSFSATAGKVTLHLYRKVGTTDTLLQSVVVPVTYTAGTPLHVRLSTVGDTSTTVRARAWVGDTEPSAWQASVTDTTATLTGAGAVGLLTFVSGSATAAMTTSFDDFVARVA